MILGTYWYTGFPEDLYAFDYFKFSPGVGGFADKPAQLIAWVRSEHPEKLLSELNALLQKYPEGYLSILREENTFRMETGAYQLFDTDFLFVQEVEKIFQKEGVMLQEDQQMTNLLPVKLENEQSAVPLIYPQKNLLRLVTSDRKKSHAENLMLRLDCHLDQLNKAEFIASLTSAAEEEDLDVFFYYDQDFEAKTNLMLFFSNGRQGVDFKPQKRTDTIRLENRVEEIMQLYGAQDKHVQGAGLYPQTGPKIERMVDEMYVLGDC